jgi:acyl carrier protein
MSTLRRLVPLLLNRLELGENRTDIHVDESLVASGLIDSLAILTVVSAVEEEFKITLEPEDINLKNFDTLRSLGTLIDSRLGNNGGCK